jgi:hypothetical protein
VIYKRGWGQRAWESSGGGAGDGGKAQISYAHVTVHEDWRAVGLLTLITSLYRDCVE